MLNDPNSDFIQKIEVFVDNKSDDATAWLLGAKGGNVIFRKNEAGQPEAIIIADGLDINTAQNVWLWNVNGLGFSSNGINGPFTTAITSDGKITADFIKAGTISADYVTVQGEALTPNSIGGGKIATNAIINRHLTSGSVHETTCNQQINDYFADVIYAQKVFAGSVECSWLKANRFDVQALYVGNLDVAWVDPISAGHTVRVLGRYTT